MSSDMPIAVVSHDVPTQVVILAGGLGTRLGPLTTRRPKVLVEILGKPFLAYQFEWLARYGLRDVVLCVGHLGEQIEAFAGDGSTLGVRLRYAYDPPSHLLGTAGCLRQAAPLLKDHFVVLNGDSYLPVDLREPLAYFERHRLSALMLVYKNTDQFDASNAVVRDGWVTFYGRGEDRRVRPDVEFIDYGLRVFRKDVLQHVAPNTRMDLDALYQALIARHQLAAYEVREPFYEVGSFPGLARFRAYRQQMELGVG